MKSIQFNILLGSITLISYLFSFIIDLINLPLFLISIFSLLLYIGEFWAFLFKIKLARIRELIKLSKGKPNSKVGMATQAGCMMFYAFLMRFVFRIVLGLITILGFSGNLNQELNTFQMIMMIIIVLFELFNLMYSLFETHIFKISGEDKETEKDIEKYWENEKKWRTKNFKILEDQKLRLKEFLATLILVSMAIICTNLFWKPTNDQFIDFIIRTHKFGESTSFAIVIVLISCFLLCLFFLMPIRLAFWIEEKMKADVKPEILKYRLSLIFAGVSICSPTIIQLVKSFVLS